MGLGSRGHKLDAQGASVRPGVPPVPQQARRQPSCPTAKLRERPGTMAYFLEASDCHAGLGEEVLEECDDDLVLQWSQSAGSHSLRGGAMPLPCTLSSSPFMAVELGPLTLGPKVAYQERTKTDKRYTFLFTALSPELVRIFFFPNHASIFPRSS